MYYDKFKEFLMQFCRHYALKKIIFEEGLVERGGAERSLLILATNPMEKTTAEKMVEELREGMSAILTAPALFIEISESQSSKGKYRIVFRDLLRIFFEFKDSLCAMLNDVHFLQCESVKIKPWIVDGNNRYSISQHVYPIRIDVSEIPSNIISAYISQLGKLYPSMVFDRKEKSVILQSINYTDFYHLREQYINSHPELQPNKGEQKKSASDKPAPVPISPYLNPGSLTIFSPPDFALPSSSSRDEHTQHHNSDYSY